MTSERITVPGSLGAPLAGIIDHADAPARGMALLAHCFTCSKDLHTTSRLARGLVGRGYSVARFDFTGIGDSGGDFASKTVDHNVRDLALVAAELVRRGLGPCALVGHSLGGAAVLLAAERVKTVRTVAVVGAPSSPTHVRRLLAVDDEALGASGVEQVRIAGRSFPISRAFLEDLARHDETGAIGALGRPLLVVHAVDDDTVEVSEGERIFAAARQPKAFMPLLGADHLLTARAAADRVTALVADWLDQTL